jgi:hypothetical protein
LSANANARHAQIEAYHNHLRKQYLDRTVYWHSRALSRVLFHAGGVTIVITLDGMDQAKFCWPRDEAMNSKEFSAFHRPRLHVTGVIVHGYFMLFTVSESDMPKDSNSCVDTIAHCIHLLAKSGIDMSTVELIVQADNCIREIKNNTVLRFLATMVGKRRLRRAELRCLVTGHSHEDIDQIFGHLATFIARHPTLHTPRDFIETVEKFMQQPGFRSHEPVHHVVKLDNVRDWYQSCHAK